MRVFFSKPNKRTASKIRSVPNPSAFPVYSGVSNENDTGIEEVITITEPFYSDNDELIYTLSPKHILGYFNTRSAEFCKNMNWDPAFNNCLFRSPAKRPVRHNKPE